MAASYHALPAELIIQVGSRLGPPNLAAFASTNRCHRSILLFTLYRDIHLYFPYLIFWASTVGLSRLVQSLLQAGASPGEAYRSEIDSYGRSLVSAAWHSHRQRDPRDILGDLYAHWTWLDDYKKLGWDWERNRLMTYHFPSAEFNSNQLELFSILDNFRYPEETPGLDISLYRYRRPILITDHWSLMHVAAYNGHDDIIRLLVSAGARLDYSSNHFCRCEILSAYTLPSPNRLPGFFDSIVLWTPLHSAICGGQFETANILISLGAPSLITHSNNTQYAISQACFSGSLSTVQALIDRDGSACVNTLDSRQLTPLYYCLFGDYNREIAELLLHQGASLDEDLGDGCTVLHLACVYGYAKVATEIAEMTPQLDSLWEDSFFRIRGACRPIEMACMSRRMIETLLRNWETLEEDKDRVSLVMKLIERGASVHPHPD